MPSSCVNLERGIDIFSPRFNGGMLTAYPDRGSPLMEIARLGQSSTSAFLRTKAESPTMHSAIMVLCELFRVLLESSSIFRNTASKTTTTRPAMAHLGKRWGDFSGWTVGLFSVPHFGQTSDGLSSDGGMSPRHFPQIIDSLLGSEEFMLVMRLCADGERTQAET